MLYSINLVTSINYNVVQCYSMMIQWSKLFNALNSKASHLDPRDPPRESRKGDPSFQEPNKGSGAVHS